MTVLKAQYHLKSRGWLSLRDKTALLKTEDIV